MKYLKQIAQDIRDVISEYQKVNQLSFIEDTHTYFIKGNDGKITSNMPSVSTVLHSFYTPFNAAGTRAFKNCLGDPIKEKSLLKEWSDNADYATNKGSRVHFILEQELVDQYGSYKEVRKPIFECDKKQLEDGDQMVIAGRNFIDLMHERGAVLLDTEIVLGSVELGYFGQPDKVWLMLDKNGVVGIVITDWKTNKKKNMSNKKMPWTVPMLSPFGYMNNNSLSHYKLQLPLYGKLLLKMLEGSKFENIQILGYIIVHLTDDGEFKEFRVDKQTSDIIKDMDVKKYLK